MNLIYFSGILIFVLKYMIYYFRKFKNKKSGNKNDRLLSTGTGTSMYESIPLNEDVLKAKERAENRAMMFSGFFLRSEEIR